VSCSHFGLGVMAVPTMYQCHGDFRLFDIYNISKNFERVPESGYTLTNQVDMVLKGRLGEATSLKDVLSFDSEIDLRGIGSFRFKLRHTESQRNVSVFIFNTGKWKLSGGIGVVNNSIELEKYIDTTIRFIESWFKLTAAREYNICCINGILRLGKAVNTRLIVSNLRAHYHHIIEPQYDKKGRRNCWKFYAFENRKCQISVGKEGNAQIFGCISIEELNRICQPLINCWND
jgi:hypothetical protein